jgi:hypothetical protein
MGESAAEQAFQPKWWNSSPLFGITTVWTTSRIALGGRVDIDHAERVGLRAVGAEQQHIGVLLDRRRHRHLGGRIEGRIGTDVHRRFSPASPHPGCRGDRRGVFLRPA